MKPLLVLFAIAIIGAAGVGGYYAYEILSTDETPPLSSEDKDRPSTSVTAADPAPNSEAPADKSVTSPGATPSEPQEKVPEAVTQSSDEVVTPSFDIVRVEKTGEAVIAGLAEPNSTVKLLNNGSVVGTATADASGAFVIVPQAPFSGESNEIWLEAQARTANGEDKKAVSSKQIVAVAVTEQNTPLVVLVEEDKPATLLQVPEEVATSAAPQNDGPKEETTVALAPDKKAGKVPETSLQAARETNEDGIGQGDKRADPTDKKHRAPAPQQRPLASAERPVATAPDKKAAGDKEVARGEETSVSGEPTPERTTPQLVETTGQISVEAVETQDDKIFIAGSTKTGATVRVYVDDDVIGDARTGGDGRWLLEGERNLEPGNYTVRADRLEPNGEVLARTEVPLEVSPKLQPQLRPQDPNQGRRIIIRRNDNLWTISRRLYGDGARFTAIYTQNSNQIRDPDLIFPGQVFELPDAELAPLQGPEPQQDQG